MPTTKVTVTLPKEQLDRVRDLIGSKSASKISDFVKHAIDVAIQDATAWRAELDEALEKTGGPLTDKERAWIDSLLLPRTTKKRAGRRKAA